MKIKKFSTLIIIISLFAMVFGISSFAKEALSSGQIKNVKLKIDQPQLKNLGEKFKQIKNLKDTKQKSRVVVTIGNDKITENDIKGKMLLLEASATEKDALEMLVKDKLLLTEAKALGIEVSTDEVLNFRDQAKKTMEEYASPEQKQEFKDMMESLGVSEDEYWNSYVIDKYRNLLISAKLKNNIRSEAIKNIEDPNEQQKAYRKALSKYVDELKVKYNVVYLNK